MNVRIQRMAIEINMADEILKTTRSFTNTNKIKIGLDLETAQDNLLKKFGALQLSVIINQSKVTVEENFERCKIALHLVRGSLIETLGAAKKIMPSFPESYLKDMTVTIRKLESHLGDITQIPETALEKFKDTCKIFAEEYKDIVETINKDIDTANEKIIESRQNYRALKNTSASEMLKKLNNSCGEERAEKRSEADIQNTLKQLERSQDDSLLLAFLAVSSNRSKPFPIKWPKKENILSPNLLSQLNVLDTKLMDAIENNTKETWAAATTAIRNLPLAVRANLHVYDSLVNPDNLHRALILHEPFRLACIYGADEIKEEYEVEIVSHSFFEPRKTPADSKEIFSKENPLQAKLYYPSGNPKFASIEITYHQGSHSLIIKRTAPSGETRMRLADITDIYVGEHKKIKNEVVSENVLTMDPKRSIHIMICKDVPINNIFHIELENSSNRNLILNRLKTLTESREQRDISMIPRK